MTSTVTRPRRQGRTGAASASGWVRSSGARRRQRGVRAVVAAVLLGAATGGVAVALAVATVTALSIAAVVAVLCGWIAVRIVHAEVVATWRRSARESAGQAEAFRTAAAAAASEHLHFVEVMDQRLAGREREVRELEGTLRLCEARAGAAEDLARREAGRADDALSRVVDLEVALAIRRAEEADELATWEPVGSDADTVVDLLAWEDRAGARAEDRRSGWADRDRRRA